MIGTLTRFWGWLAFYADTPRRFRPGAVARSWRYARLDMAAPRKASRYARPF